MSEGLEQETAIELNEEQDQGGLETVVEQDPVEEGEPEVAESGVDAVPQTEGQQQPKKKPTFEERQRVIAQKTWEMRETERRLSETENRVNATLAKLEAAQHAASNPKPTAEYYETTEAYIEALTDWKIGQANAPKAQAQPQPQNDVAKEWQYKRESAMKEHPDFWDNEVQIRRVIDHYQNPHIGQMIMESDKYKMLVQHLGKNQDKLERIAKMSPLSAAKEIGRLEDQLSPAPVRRITAAPAPVSNNSGKSGGTVQKDYSKMSASEFMAQRNAETSKRR